MGLFNGWRCNDFQEFVNAAKEAEKMQQSQRYNILDHAQKTWSMGTVALQYDKYLKRLANLKDKGWYQEY